MSYFIIKTDYLNFNSSFLKTTCIYLLFKTCLIRRFGVLYRNANHSNFFILRSKLPKILCLRQPTPSPTPGNFWDPRM